VRSETDVALVEGFDPAWAPSPTLARRVTLTVREKPLPIGTGTSAHFVAHTTWQDL
jgi:hypothetical protein